MGETGLKMAYIVLYLEFLVLDCRVRRVESYQNRMRVYIYGNVESIRFVVKGCCVRGREDKGEWGGKRSEVTREGRGRVEET